MMARMALSNLVMLVQSALLLLWSDSSYERRNFTVLLTLSTSAIDIFYRFIVLLWCIQNSCCISEFRDSLLAVPGNMLTESRQILTFIASFSLRYFCAIQTAYIWCYYAVRRFVIPNEAPLRIGDPQVEEVVDNQIEEQLQLAGNGNIAALPPVGPCARPMDPLQVQEMVEHVVNAIQMDEQMEERHQKRDGPLEVPDHLEQAGNTNPLQPPKCRTFHAVNVKYVPNVGFLMNKWMEERYDESDWDDFLEVPEQTPLQITKQEHNNTRTQFVIGVGKPLAPPSPSSSSQAELC